LFGHKLADSEKIIDVKSGRSPFAFHPLSPPIAIHCPLYMQLITTALTLRAASRTQNPEPGNPLNIPMLQQLRVPTVNAISSRNAAPGGQLRNVNQAWL